MATFRWWGAGRLALDPIAAVILERSDRIQGDKSGRSVLSSSERSVGDPLCFFLAFATGTSTGFSPSGDYAH